MIKPAPLPTGLKELILKKRKGHQLAAPLPEQIPKGSRNTVLASAAGSLRRRGASEAVIRKALETINEDCCQPPLRRHEVARIARSIGRLKPQKHSGDQKLPLIDAGNGDLEEITEQALAAVLDANDPPHLFRQGGIPVRLERDDEDRIITTAITPNRLRQFLASTCRFFKDSTKAGQYTVHPPMPVVHNILATPDLPLPVLRRITECPIFLIDGTLHDQPGYHPGARSYYEPSKGFKFRPLPQQITKAHVQKAVALIVDDLLVDFPFTGQAELANAIALFLLPYVRDLIDGPVPLTLIEKPSPGTGAGLLADVLTFPFLGRPIASMTGGRDEDEWRKRLTALLRTSPAYVLIDNVNRLDAASLSSVITATFWED